VITVDSNVTINRPPMEVFDFVRDQDNAAKWLSGWLETRPTNKTEGVGYTWIDVVEMFGRPVETEFELTGLEPGQRIAFRSIGGSFPISGVYSFSPSGQGAAVSFELKGEPAGFFKLAEPLLGRMLQRQWDANVANLKDVLESTT
jgi:uncharacterized protein YndB with AHSA1/START domain